ncbi:hypothetical protein Tco_0161266, partial [Tanacetum coccineum]
MPRGVPRHGGWPISGCHVAALTDYCAGLQGTVAYE